jgi:large subunit ribosomal protein L16
MGKGKGAVDHYVAVVRPGLVMFEMADIDEETAREALRLAAFKLPIATKFIKRTDPISGEEVADDFRS